MKLTLDLLALLRLPLGCQAKAPWQPGSPMFAAIRHRKKYKSKRSC
jgi:hypothetical protein